MEKIVLFAFKGETMCFMHVLLNALDMHGQSAEVKTIIEGTATKLIWEMPKPESPLFTPYNKTKGLNLIGGVCRTCSIKMGVPHEAES